MWSCRTTTMLKLAVCKTPCLEGGRLYTVSEESGHQAMPRSPTQHLPSLYKQTFIRTPELTEKAPSWDKPTVP